MAEAVALLAAVVVAVTVEAVKEFAPFDAPKSNGASFLENVIAPVALDERG